MNEKIKVLKAQNVTDATEARSILKKAEDESKRALTNEEAAKVKGLLDGIEARKASIEQEERLSGFEREQAAPASAPAHLPSPAPAQSITQSEVRCMVLTRNEQGRESYVEGRAIDPTKEFRTLGEQLSAVVAAANGRMDRRLQEQRAATGAGETIGSDGGFGVQQDFASELYLRTYDIGQVLSRVRRIPVSANANGLKMFGVNETSRANGSRYGGIQVYRAAEADTVTATKPKFRLMELNLKKLMGLCYATDELLQDTTALEAVIMQAFPEEFSFKIEDEIMNGTGAGQMAGFLKSLALVVVAKEVGQDAATVVAENVVKMYARMWPRSIQNAVWLVNQEVFPTLYTMGLTVGTGGAPIFMPAGGLSGSPFNTLLGRPVIPVEYAAGVGSEGDIVFVDLSQYLMIDKGGLQAANSIHVRFLNDEQVFRFIMRNDGQPAWNNKLTPFKGTATVSPYVTLAAR